MKRFSVLMCTGVAIATISGCASNEPAETAALTARATLSQADETPSPTVAATPDAAGDDAPAAADPTSCLHGTWLADNAFFLERIREFGTEVRDVSGQVLITFEPSGALATAYDNWTITGVSEGAEMRIIRHGVDTGTYEVTGATVRLTETKIGSALTLTSSGMEMSVPPRPSSYDGANYTCDAQSAEINTADGGLRLTR